VGNRTRKRILVAVDGSEQALEAVRYVSRSLAPMETDVILFHVMTRIPESFFDLEKEPQFRYKIANIKAWETQQEKIIEEFFAKGRQILSLAGFPPEAVIVDIQERRAGIARDILAESQRGYDAIVLGRKGLSELKDIVLGSVAIKLVEKVSHLPIWVVGGKPAAGKILISMDTSEGAGQAMRYVAAMTAGAPDITIRLVHAIRGFDVFNQILGSSIVGSQEAEWLEMAQRELDDSGKEIIPVFEEATKCFLEAGLDAHRVSHAVLKGVSSRSGAIVEEAEREGCDTIVLGRRGLSRVQEFFMGRVSNKVIHLAREKTVWVVS